MSGRMLSRWAVVMAAIVGLGFVADEAQARRGRGPSKAQQAATKEKQQQQAALKAAATKAQKAKDKDLMSKYDLNKNGKIDGTEKPAWDKFWREVELGIIPHPYSSIKIDKDDLKTDPKKKK